MPVASSPPGTTPTLVVDTDILDRNIAGMAAWAHGHGLALRPHAKTHKTAEIAARQRLAGAAGLTVATLGEAEVFAAAGFDDVFIAYPLWADPHRAHRLARLAERVKLRVGVDSPDAAAALGKAVAGLDTEVLVEIDSGHHRSGVPPTSAPTVADAAARAGLHVLGVFTFPGHSYAPGSQRQAARDEAQALAQATASLEAGGHPVTVRSGGSTPSAAHTDTGVVTELRPGVYVYNDAQQLALGTCEIGDIALTALATVVSVPAADRFILDAGSKILGADRPAWLEGFGVLPSVGMARVAWLSEHHAVVTPSPDHPLPRPGDTVTVIPNHVCTVANLVDEITAMTAGSPPEIWHVIARGRNT